MARILFRCFGRLISQLFCFSLRFAFCCSLFLFLFFMHAFCLVFDTFFSAGMSIAHGRSEKDFEGGGGTLCCIEI